jgi:hypothetical protein
MHIIYLLLNHFITPQFDRVCSCLQNWLCFTLELSRLFLKKNPARILSPLDFLNTFTIDRLVNRFKSQSITQVLIVYTSKTKCTWLLIIHQAWISNPLFFDKMLDFQEIKLCTHYMSKYIQPTYKTYKLPDYKTYNFYHSCCFKVEVNNGSL